MPAVPDPSAAAGWATVLWPVAVLGHLAANPGHLVAGDGVGALQLVLVGLAGALVARPSRLLAGGLAGLYLLVFWLKLPAVGNHEVILALVALGMSWGLADRRPGWTVRAAPVCRAALIVSYGFIALSKFNRGFLDPAVSCATLFGDEVGHLFGLRPGSDTAAALVVIWATVLVEAAIPLLLVTRLARPTGGGAHRSPGHPRAADDVRRRRTRWRGAPPPRSVGVLLALSFHFLLALDPSSHVWDFSSTLLPLFLLFLPLGFHRQLDGLVARWRARPPVERAASVGLVIAAQGLALAGPLPDWFPAYPLWLALGGAVTVAATRHAFLDGGGRGPLIGAVPVGPRRRRSAGVALVVLLGLANGLAPYGELRTAAAFNMYSNLRIIDGESNHLLVPALPLGLDRPLAAVVDPPAGSELAYYEAAGMVVPMENLERYATAWPEETVVARVGEGPARLVGPDAELGLVWRVIGELEHKLAFRRAVDGAEPARCLRSWGPIG